MKDIHHRAKQSMETETRWPEGLAVLGVEEVGHLMMSPEPSSSVKIIHSGPLPLASITLPDKHLSPGGLDGPSSSHMAAGRAR